MRAARAGSPVLRAVVAVAGLLAILGHGMASASEGEGKRHYTPTTGQALYIHACASCHGPDGTGAQASAVGLPIVPPDFTDSQFASREPAADWAGVASLGGPVRGFDRLMPAFEEGLTRREIDQILTYVETLYEDRSWPRGEFNLPKALGTEKAYLEDEYYLQTTVGTGETGSVMTKFVYERRVGSRHQIEVVAPVGRQQISRAPGADKVWVSGIGDMAVGLKRVLYHDLSRGTIVSATLEAILPTGDEADGFGKGYTVLEPFVTWGQLLPLDAFIQVQSGVELPTDTDHENEGLMRVALGRTSTMGGEWGRAVSPMVEFLGAGELSGGSWAWDVMPEAHFTLNQRQHVMANLGVRFPMTQRSGRDPELLFMVLWDWFDGGLLEGW